MKLRKVVYFVCFVLFTQTVQTPHTQASLLLDPRFGAVEAYRAPDLAQQTGIGWDRVRVHWDKWQPTGPKDWVHQGQESSWIATANAQGRQVAGLLITTPSWATNGKSKVGVPTGLDLPIDDPNNVWAGFVRKIVTEYKGQVHHWIIWNEPDVLADHWGLQFDGTEAEYYRLLKVAYLVAKDVDPTVKIHMAGLTYWHDWHNGLAPYLQRFLNVAITDPDAPANNYFFDAITAHVYFRSGSVYDIIAFQKNILRTYGLDKPVWLNETNAPPFDDPYKPWDTPLVPITMEQQADFFVQAPLLAFAAGAERIAAYNLFDPAGAHPQGDSYGIYRPNRTPRPAALSYQHLIRRMSGFQSLQLQRLARYDRVKVTHPLRETTVLWNRTGVDEIIYLSAHPWVVNVEIVDKYGAVVDYEVNGSNYVITLPGANCLGEGGECYVGGGSIFVVETLAEPVVPTAVPHPSATPLPTGVTEAVITPESTNEALIPLTGVTEIPPTEATTASVEEYDVYSVQPGDSLARIAANHLITIPELISLNGLETNVLQIGQELLVPKRTFLTSEEEQ